MADLFEAAGLTPAQPSPLADRLRPQRLEEVVGQDHLLGPEGPIGRMAAAKRLSSMILWGPPGTGKTTIARLLARAAGYQFQQLSAVFTGVADLKKAFETARGRRAAGQATLLFVDEIHRFNRAQHRHPGGRDHREPILRAERRFALARPGLCAEAAGRRGAGGLAGQGRGA
jgi:putative ATPase